MDTHESIDTSKPNSKRYAKSRYGERQGNGGRSLINDSRLSGFMWRNVE